MARTHKTEHSHPDGFHIGARIDRSRRRAAERTMLVALTRNPDLYDEADGFDALDGELAR